MGLGRVSLRITNAAQQPVWNEGRDVCAVIEGELYDSQALHDKLVQQGYHFESSDDSELVLHAYQAYAYDPPSGKMFYLNRAYDVRKGEWDPAPYPGLKSSG